ncbi:MAG: MurR/RpiR family transcriptional regulator, partial [Parvibaculaceae bacterium]|nr:MurR/RpiR family transcriptional regulator [Parvibaculaceae bacterium]
ASVSDAASTSAPSIVRFAVTLGFDGFTDLQARVRHDLSNQISSAYKRARNPSDGNELSDWIAVETLNVQETLAAIDPDQLKQALTLLTDSSRRIFILPSEQWLGPGITFRDFLQLIRGRVRLLHGTPFRVSTELGAANATDVLLTMDGQRNEKWVVKTHTLAREIGLQTITISDSPLNPIAKHSEINFSVSRATCGLFDSKTGLTVLLSYLLDAISKSIDGGVVRRLEKSESLWKSSDVLS